MKKKTKIFGAAALIIIIAAVFVMIGGTGASEIQIAGSTSVQPVAEKLVETYKQTHPDAKINVQGGGSSVGIKSVQDGTADIGTSSKELKDNEKQGLTEYTLGQDGIVIAVNTANGVSDLTAEQLKGIYSGNITNWNQVGGSDGQINVITREDGSGTLDAFKSIVMNGSDIKGDAVVQSSTEAVKQSVQQDSNAIGFVSYAHMTSDVKAINVNGVAPSNSTIADGTYELQRPFIFLVKGTPDGDLKTFIDWVNGPEGQKIIADEKIVKSTV